MKFKKLTVVLLSAAMSIFMLIGCSNDNGSNNTKKDLIYSKSQGPYSELFEQGIKPILEKKGYKIDKKKININNPLNTIGHHLVEVELYKNIKAELNIELNEK